MRQMHSSSIRVLTAALGLSLGIFVCSLPSLSLAKSPFSPPTGRGLPGRREPAGTRDGCFMPEKVNPRSTDLSSKNLKTLAALIPDTNLGLTVSEYPTFFWYLPKNNATGVEFVLFNPSNQKIYQATFTVTGQPGVISISLPTNAGLPPLEIGKSYKWTLQALCQDQAMEPLVGWVQRIAISQDLATALQKAAPRDRPNIYGAAGIWQETITSLAEMRRANPKDSRLNNTWAELLRGVKLDKIAKEPLIMCCQPNTAPVSSLSPSR